VVDGLKTGTEAAPALHVIVDALIVGMKASSIQRAFRFIRTDSYKPARSSLRRWRVYAELELITIPRTWYVLCQMHTSAVVAHKSDLWALVDIWPCQICIIELRAGLGPPLATPDSSPSFTPLLLRRPCGTSNLLLRRSARSESLRHTYSDFSELLDSRSWSRPRHSPCYPTS